ncbi:hypothetical protein [Actinomadura sp. 6N118]|uniref:hypothetical protein n=1 Tax=Actinomadura sp. 6N118 TaxID=3375151 RepID=UPI0037A502AD
MLSRSAGKPIFVGLSTAALVAAGGIPAWADDPSPTTTTSTSTAPSNPESPEVPPIPRLTVDVTPGESSASPGTRVKVITLITAEQANAADVKIESIVAKSSQAKVKPTVTGPCPSPFTGERCKLGEITKGNNKAIVSYVTVREKLEKTTSVTFTVTVSGKDIKAKTSAAKFTYVVKPTKPPKPKPTPSPRLTPDSGDGPSDGKSGKSGSGSGSNNSGSNGSNSGGNSAPYVPPRPNGTFNPSTQSPRVALPPIAQPSPSVAPAAAPPSPNSRLRGNERPVAQDLTFERMASTQVAWLAALMVAFSLLLTQLRLGRRRTGPAAAPIRPRGDHRRPRRGIFGK